MYPNSIYFGLKAVPTEVFWAPKAVNFESLEP